MAGDAGGASAQLSRPRESRTAMPAAWHMTAGATSTPVAASQSTHVPRHTATQASAYAYMSPCLMCAGMVHPRAAAVHAAEPAALCTAANRPTPAASVADPLFSASPGKTLSSMMYHAPLQKDAHAMPHAICVGRSPTAMGTYTFPPKGAEVPAAAVDCAFFSKAEAANDLPHLKSAGTLEVLPLLLNMDAASKAALEVVVKVHVHVRATYMEIGVERELFILNSQPQKPKERADSKKRRKGREGKLATNYE